MNVPGSSDDIVAHSCEHCQTFVVRLPSEQQVKEALVGDWLPVAEIDGSKVKQAASDGCAFFEWLLNELKDSEDCDILEEIDHTWSLCGGICEQHLEPGGDLCLMDLRWFCEEHMMHDVTWFGVLAEHGDPAARYIRRKASSRNMASETAFDLAQTWLRHCQETHARCRTLTQKSMPSRVIEIQWEDDADQPSLRLLLNAPWEKYAALSYCWGGDQPITATKTALDLLSQFIPFSELPTCLQDAVITAWRLSLRLLWVDSLCVVQDDPGDIAREIAKMPQIYNNAHVTISAARSSSSHDGFLHDLSVPSAQAAIFKIPFHCPDTLFGSIILFQEPGGVHLYNPVDKRAWTLQEHVLSRRVLKYGTHQLSWSCLIEEHYEEDDAGSNWWSRRDQRMSALHNLLRGSVDRTEPKKEEWEKVVADYTSRKLSVPSDRLLAISGIAKVYGDQTKDQYLAGLWLSDLPFSLLWEISSPLQPRPPEYRAPSWSWASVDGHIGRSFDRIPIDPDFRLLSWKMATVESSAPYGGLDFGYIKLQGRVRRALWVDNRNTLIDPDTGDADDGEALAYTSPDINEGFYGNNGHSDRILVWCLQICPYDSVRDLGPLGLIMTTTDGQTFQRLGAFSFDRDVYRKSKESHDFYTFHREKQQRWADGCKLQTIRII